MRVLGYVEPVALRFNAYELTHRVGNVFARLLHSHQAHCIAKPFRDASAA